MKCCSKINLTVVSGYVVECARSVGFKVGSSDRDSRAREGGGVFALLEVWSLRVSAAVRLRHVPC